MATTIVRRSPTRRRIGHGVIDALTGLPLFATAPLYRHWHMHWGANEEEVRGPMPGDDLVADAQFNATRAITIDARPDRVWPWIVQLGYGRAGFYTYDLLDNGGYESAHRVLAEFQHARVGDWVPMARRVNDTTAHHVTAFEPNRWMLWSKPDSTWAWKLVPLDGGGTRLIIRLKQHLDWRSPGAAVVTLVLMEFGDFPMMRRVLMGIRTRSERMP
jgi:hypothetical protein